MTSYTARAGFTLIEVVVAIFVFTIGALALAGGGAIVGTNMHANAVRESASRIAATRLELLRAACSAAVSGEETIGQVRSAWVVAPLGPARFGVSEKVIYPTISGMRTDTYRLTVGCR